MLPEPISSATAASCAGLWHRTTRSARAATSALLCDQFLLHIIVNGYWAPLEFELPPLTEAYEPWRRCIDTFLAPPHDVCPLEDGPIVPTTTYRVQPRSLVVLFAKERTDAHA